jgi:hypothetical protein
VISVAKLAVWVETAKRKSETNVKSTIEDLENDEKASEMLPTTQKRYYNDFIKA